MSLDQTKNIGVDERRRLVATAVELEELAASIENEIAAGC